MSGWMTVLVLAGARLAAPAVELADGRTGWLLGAGGEMTIPATAPLIAEVRFHYGTEACDPAAARVEVWDGTRLVERRSDLGETIHREHRDFEVRSGAPVRVEVAGATTVLRLVGSRCGATVSFAR